MVRQPYSVAFTDTVCRGAPLADSIERQDGRPFIRTREEGAGCMAFVMLEKNKRAPDIVTQIAAKTSSHEKFFFKPNRHCHGEAAQTSWSKSKIGLEQTFKFHQRFVVKGNIGKIARLRACFLQAVPDGVCGKTGIMFLAGEALLLGGG